MKVTRKIGLLSLLLVAALFVQDASASLLPFSTSGDAEGWQGSRSYSYNVVGYGIVSGRVYFTVYDTENLVLEGEIALDDEWTMPGRYIYAYQIFNDQEAVLSFAIFNEIAGVSLDVDEEDIGSLEDIPDSGVERTAIELTAGNLQVIWEFEEFGAGILDGGEHSYFLLLSTDGAPVVGDFEIKALKEGDLPVPPEIPEPATITLLGIGAAMLLGKRRKSI